MTPAELAATRHLLGLTAEQLGNELGINPRTIRAWESGKYKPSPGPMDALTAIRAEHDAETDRLTVGAEDGTPIYLPSGPRPAGWYLALAARVIDRVPDAMIDWAGPREGLLDR